MQDGSDLPSSFSLDDSSGSQQVKVIESDPTQTGSFSLRIVLTDPTTGETANIDFVALIKCVRSITLVSNSETYIEYNAGEEVL